LLAVFILNSANIQNEMRLVLRNSTDKIRIVNIFNSFLGTQAFKAHRWSQLDLELSAVASVPLDIPKFAHTV
jgi:hypothetical protein